MSKRPSASKLNEKQIRLLRNRSKRRQKGGKPSVPWQVLQTDIVEEMKEFQKALQKEKKHRRMMKHLATEPVPSSNYNGEEKQGATNDSRDE